MMDRFTRWFRRATAMRRPIRNSVRARPQVESLEHRCVPTTVQFNFANYTTGEGGGVWLDLSLSDIEPEVVTVDFATADGTALAPADYIARSGTVTFQPGEVLKGVFVPITNDDLVEGDEGITVGLSNPSPSLTMGTNATANVTILDQIPPPGWVTTPVQRVTDVAQGLYAPFGNAAVAPQTGELRVEYALDFDQSPGVGGGGVPALVYSSSAADPRPIVEATFESGPYYHVPASIRARLTWDNGTPGPWVTFGTAGHAGPNDSYALGIQLDAPVEASGRYPFRIELEADLFTPYGEGNVTRIADGHALVSAHGNDAPFGHGWSLAGFDRLLADNDGVT